MKYGYVAVPRNQPQTGSQPLYLVSRQFLDLPLAQIVRHFYTVKVKFESFIRNFDVLCKLRKVLAIILLYDHLHRLIIDEILPATAKGEFTTSELFEAKNK